VQRQASIRQPGQAFDYFFVAVPNRPRGSDDDILHALGPRFLAQANELAKLGFISRRAFMGHDHPFSRLVLVWVSGGKNRRLQETVKRKLPRLSTSRVTRGLTFWSPHHRLSATAADRDDECCQRGNEPGESVNQQSEINSCHGIFLVFRRPSLA
jgi:hypothetical protein